MSDRLDEERLQHATPPEGVRILGAAEAHAMVGGLSVPDDEGKHEDDNEDDSDGDADAPIIMAEIVDLDPNDPDAPGPDDIRLSAATGAPDRDADSTAAFPAVPPSPSTPATDRPISAPPASTDAPVSSTSPAPSVSPTVPVEDRPSGEVPPLPHWTEPPTGAMPAIFAGEEVASEDELDAWTTISGNQPRFHADGSDWSDADYAETPLTDDAPKLGALAEEAPVDEEAAFAEELAARRRRTPRGRAARTLVTTPPPASGRRPPPARAENELVPPGAAHGRDLPTAIITAAGVGTVALACFSLGTTWTVGLAAIIVGLAAIEFSNALRLKGFRPATPLALVGSFLLPIAAKHYGIGSYAVFFAMMVVVSMLWFLWEVTPGRPLLGVATTLLAFAYVGGLGGFAGSLLQFVDGVGLIIGVATCTIAYDVFGYFVGSQFGKSPIATRISPHKTLEGTLAGTLASVLFGWLVIGGGISWFGIAPWSPGQGAVLGLCVAVGAFLGDLCESMLKRDLGLKDFGSLLPGHGGVLDRFDSLLFCLPIAYFLALQFKFVLS